MIPSEAPHTKCSSNRRILVLSDRVRDKVKKGEKRPDKETNRADEWLFDLSLRKDFSSDVASLRRKLEIPDEGFRPGEMPMEWRDHVPYWYIPPYYAEGEMFELFKKYNIPLKYSDEVRTYIETGQVKSKKRPLDLIGLVDQYAHNAQFPGDLDTAYREFGQPFVKIYLFDGTKEQVHRFIDKNWPLIRDVFAQQGVDADKSVKVTIMKKEHQMVIKYWRKQIDELKRLARIDQRFSNLKTGSREQWVWRAIMACENSKISVDMIKKIGYEYDKPASYP